MMRIISGGIALLPLVSTAYIAAPAYEVLVGKPGFRNTMLKNAFSVIRF